MKMVTRTIMQYDHMLVKFNSTDGTFDEKHVIFDTKMGSRKINAYIKDNGLDGYTLVKVEVKFVKYAMPQDKFIEAATIISDEEG